MKRILNYLAAATMGVSLLTALSSTATPVTVQELSVGPEEVVNITSSTLGTADVYAGINKLLVNGVATDGFCIDPFHWSLTGVQNYDAQALSASPKPPGGPMGSAEAMKIEQLWQYAYAPGMTDAQAAGLQIAIWEVIGAGATGGATFKLNGNDYGASGLLTWVNNNPNAAAANLLGLTGPGQDYVIPNSGGGGGSVPDSGATLLLFGGALCGLFILRRQACIS
jgi:hypothetical protein